MRLQNIEEYPQLWMQQVKRSLYIGISIAFKIEKNVYHTLIHFVQCKEPNNIPAYFSPQQQPYELCWVQRE